MQEGILVLKCFQLLADALDKILTLEQVLGPNFHKQIEAMLKSMSDSKVSHPFSLPYSTAVMTHAPSHVCVRQFNMPVTPSLQALTETASCPALIVAPVHYGNLVISAVELINATKLQLASQASYNRMM